MKLIMDARPQLSLLSLRMYEPGELKALTTYILKEQEEVRPHSAEDCLMLWKLTRVGEVGMDMARATLARMECLSCQRCHRFRTAERT
ncbi:hypothetical protein SKAU_G00296340 [Synaphobranchus kaupii]|uniref:Uncharacterized protein n=1 Tax=Synaphobranchus kaupii TaxID=118154 RepID=A0A9Q1EUT4_SYNKA|nr:hypothetical protein SKAU_G00296340 [Synaphobranchus kaupii]